MGKGLIKEYNEFEDQLIKKFNKDGFYDKFKNFTKEEFKEYLLQLGFLSLEFVKFIERAKLPLNVEIGKEAVREILRDEIPAEGPTHQDNRYHDLKLIGLTDEEILNTSPNEKTKETINKYYELVKYPQDKYDLKVLIILRVMGEVLVGETYKYVVEGLKNHYGIKEEDSLFYTFHWQHDQKGGKGDEGGSGHTEYYDKVLGEIIVDEETLEIAKDAAQKSFDVRTDFHSQFM